MTKFNFKDKDYEVDLSGFLVNMSDWTEDFAEGMAKQSKIPDGLTEEHWKVINFIRSSFVRKNSCPTIYDTCKSLDMPAQKLKLLFPTGYQRGACKIAGISYKEGYLCAHYMDKIFKPDKAMDSTKFYTIDAKGFLIDALEWDENFAVVKAEELKMPELLTEAHWEIIYYLRDRYLKTQGIPTVFVTLEDNGISLEQLELLFPDGYHRGAVKISGLRLV